MDAQLCPRPRTASQMAEPAARRASESPPGNAPPSPGAPHPHKQPPSSHSPLTADTSLAALLEAPEQDVAEHGHELPPPSKRMRMAEQLPQQPPPQLPAAAAVQAQAPSAGAQHPNILMMYEKQPEVSPNAASNRSDRDILMLPSSDGIVLPASGV